jgi:N-methylhydantoinase B
MTVPQGSLIVHEQAGGGGFGDPAARNPALIAEDLVDGKITEAFVRRHYAKSVVG